MADFASLLWWVAMVEAWLFTALVLLSPVLLFRKPSRREWYGMGAYISTWLNVILLWAVSVYFVLLTTRSVATGIALSIAGTICAVVGVVLIAAVKLAWYHMWSQIVMLAVIAAAAAISHRGMARAAYRT